MLKKLLGATIAFIISSGAFGQNLRLGTSIIDAGVNYNLYTQKATDLSTLSVAKGSLSGVTLSGAYNYAVTEKTTLRAQGGYSFFGAASCYQLNVGAEYHFRLSHTIDPFDLYIEADGGYSHMNYKGGIIPLGGTFRGPGILGNVGFGLRKFLGSLGLFVDANYAIIKYNGGEVKGTDQLKIPYAISLSGFNFGGGLCWKFVPAHQNLY